MIDFIGAKNHILGKLRKELDPKLTYHNLCHSLDVHEAVIRLSQPEQISKKELLLLETAALYHDSGMMVKYADHESYSIKIAGDSLPGFGYSQQETMEVSDLIRVTTLPQQAKTHLEKIICDADLDSMGREDFFNQSFIAGKLAEIGATLSEDAGDVLSHARQPRPARSRPLQPHGSEIEAA